MPSANGVVEFFNRYCLSPADRVGSAILEAMAKEAAGMNGPTAPSDAACVPAQVFNRFVRQLLRDSPLTAARGFRFKDDHNDTCMYIERSKNLNVVAYTINYQGTDSFLTTRLSSTTSDTTGPFLQPPRGLRQVETKDPLRAYWIKIEPEHVARRRGRGEMEDVCKLSMIEKKMAYGCNASASGHGGDVEQFKKELFGSRLTSVDMSPAVLSNAELWFHAFQPCQAVFVALSAWPVVVFSLPPLMTNATTTSASTDAAAGTTPDSTPPFPRDDTTVPVMFVEINKEMSILHKVYVKSIEPKHFYQLPSVEYIEAFGVSLATGKETYEKRKP